MSYVYESPHASVHTTQNKQDIKVFDVHPRETPPKGERGNPLEEEWLKAFNLKNLDEPFMPSFSPAVQQALEPVLKWEQIQLTRGSLVKLAKRQRDSLLPHIKPALEQSDMILREKRTP
ncbi:hypothetical protein [Helicobacter felis]|uniref:hypothetical protein n=1 Tax=Helicobacter felis TaxID=214 RepID=UPI000CF0D436|nr:hypothetical protein [Helicobacter felis]